MNEIESLIQRGVVSLNIGPIPNAQGQFFAVAVHACTTGTTGNHNKTEIQKTGEDIQDILSDVSSAVDHANQLKKEQTIVQVRQG